MAHKEVCKNCGYEIEPGTRHGKMDSRTCVVTRESLATGVGISPQYSAPAAEQPARCGACGREVVSGWKHKDDGTDVCLVNLPIGRLAAPASSKSSADGPTGSWKEREQNAITPSDGKTTDLRAADKSVGYSAEQPAPDGVEEARKWLLKNLAVNADPKLTDGPYVAMDLRGIEGNNLKIWLRWKDGTPARINEVLAAYAAPAIERAERLEKDLSNMNSERLGEQLRRQLAEAELAKLREQCDALLVSEERANEIARGLSKRCGSAETRLSQAVELLRRCGRFLETVPTDTAPLEALQKMAKTGTEVGIYEQQIRQLEHIAALHKSIKQFLNPEPAEGGEPGGKK